MTADVPLPLEQAWIRALQALALQGVTITTSDKQSGVIQFNGSYQGQAGLFSCPRSAGAVVKEVYSGSLVVRAAGDSASSVSIQSSGVETRSIYRHFVVIRTSRVFHDTNCMSTGKLEQSLLQRLTGP
jgi:hypothetical protein